MRQAGALTNVAKPVRAVERAACLLWEAMEHLDPSEDGAVDWAGLTHWEREYYELALERLFERPEIVAACIEEFSNNHRVCGK